ncbi:GNAT family N-acetyltransferase [Gynuella sp.]|uniref:GNAT family N-acetyltransferase n=1 Tax=Gynuella sp. TaxID=2969146 RepID=UPI003D0A57CA
MNTCIITWTNSILEIDKEAYNALQQSDYPFLSYQFLSALEESGVCTADNGWQPMFLCVYQDSVLVGVMPGYLKSHSYGEYVFDWSWAHAYDQHQLPYYPKFISAVPFTPVMGPRFLWDKHYSEDDVGCYMIEAIKTFCQENKLSSWHCLFPDPKQHACLENLSDIITRVDCQYHWHNRNYQAFEDFLSRMTSRKRKNIKKERRKIIEQGLRVERFTGTGITDELLEHFYMFYHSTYLKRGRQGYLNKSFFESVLGQLRDQMLLVMAFREDQPVAGSLFFYDQNALYGRYWGSLQEYDGLHFECCYYQGIEFCIEHSLLRFDPGTQGEHKISRGFEPTFTHSLHYISHSAFRDAINRFVQQERIHIEAYANEARSLLPFNQENS